MYPLSARVPLITSLPSSSASALSQLQAAYWHVFLSFKHVIAGFSAPTSLIWKTTINIKFSCKKNINIINQLKKIVRLDTNRVFVTGLFRVTLFFSGRKIRKCAGVAHIVSFAGRVDLVNWFSTIFGFIWWRNTIAAVIMVVIVPKISKFDIHIDIQ